MLLRGVWPVTWIRAEVSGAVAQEAMFYFTTHYKQ